ncbi:MAG: hypothetical protein A2729_06060 [Candidatus Buchananbacteria bacterium RIFCSPHIGHO2_01_FULL_39_14]|uniref:GIY-YIG domain-containing protein n=1 Tax=Candidatus Buchananbacteria bacterium RIFCSPHIGHO2_01_FULL_39_14 TaxID=1797532 RepID=A0A1G1XWA7_9BACT|nr:MAG: hypothetical protein A2729_06060 [Candidatus Buchananbacteria bacterium RIFCSPHIGHO2_01_FULL_39_14]
MKACFHLRAERAANKEYPGSLLRGAKGERSEHLCESRACSGVNTLYYEVYQSEKDAKIREKHLNYFGQAYSRLKLRISDSLKTF